MEQTDAPATEKVQIYTQSQVHAIFAAKVGSKFTMYSEAKRWVLELHMTPNNYIDSHFETVTQ